MRSSRYSGYRNFFWYKPRKRGDHKVALEKYRKILGELEPVSVQGRKIATTFWGKAWCDHFESMADYENRLPRGRTYVRGGAVNHLKLSPGNISALVSGTDLYEVKVEISPLPQKNWETIKNYCHGKISTMVDLLMGKFSPEVMEVVCDPKEGLFPNPGEIKFTCSCPDSAILCKHVAAVFYGVGNRLDTSPELLFIMRQVDPLELLTIKAGDLLDKDHPKDDELFMDDLGALFGVELDFEEEIQKKKSRGSPKSVLTSKAPTQGAAKQTSTQTSTQTSKQTSKKTQELKTAPKKLKKLGRPVTKKIVQIEDDELDDWDFEAPIYVSKGSKKPQASVVLTSKKDKLKGAIPSVIPSRKDLKLEILSKKSPSTAKTSLTINAKIASCPRTKKKEAPTVTSAGGTRLPNFQKLKGPELKKKRLKLGLSLDTCSKQIGVSIGTLYNWEAETGTINFRVSTLAALEKWWKKNI
ncbi:MAG: SWIM zinc finger family protein [Deltaproteobacteria bacterium]|jgi:uncharacterized Zn finger protein/DNA-binding transcriptional regulator YiaG|nr:SWIM zinc finger family protein [Deltaproteobacteria bacterium]